MQCQQQQRKFDTISEPRKAVRFVLCTVSSQLVYRVFRFVVLSISGNRLFQLGETTSIRCSTPVPVQSIQWVDEMDRVVVNGMAVQDLELNIMITPDSNNTMYTCKINDGAGPNQFMESSEAIMIAVDRNHQYYVITAFYPSVIHYSWSPPSHS